jgi:peptidyl-prolyl cis-trans isomerase A (cyclophilin A)
MSAMPLFVRAFLALLILLQAPFLAMAASAAPGDGKPMAGKVRVRIETSMGNIVVALDAKRAPLTTANFLKYVDDGRFENTRFYRASRAKSDASRGFIQGGIDTDFRRTIVPGVPLESTSKTGIKHLAGVISMARREETDSATGNFSLLVSPAPGLDAGPGRPGYAAFGNVISGMDVVKKIHVLPTCCGKGVMFGQMIQKDVRILRVVRLDGKPAPTTFVRPWLFAPSKGTRN